MKILALDLATRTGWAFARGWSAPTFGAEQLKSASGDEFGPLLRDFHDWLCDKITDEQPDRLIFEAPFDREGRNPNTARILFGLPAIAELIADIREIKAIEVHSATVRAHFCGSGTAKKDDVGRRCREIGWPVADHNAADALALLDYARHRLLDDALDATPIVDRNWLVAA